VTTRPDRRVGSRSQTFEKAPMDPVIVVNIYLNQDSTSASSGTPRAVVAQGSSGTSPGMDIPPPPTLDPAEASTAVDGVPAPPDAPSEQGISPPPVPAGPSDLSDDDVPPPPVVDVDPAGGAADIPPPPPAD
jgi:hypothetical protein